MLEAGRERFPADLDDTLVRTLTGIDGDGAMRVAGQLGESVWGTVRIAERPDLPALLDLLEPAVAPPAR